MSDELVQVVNANGKATIELHGKTADVIAGGNETDGNLLLKDGEGNQRISLSGIDSEVWIGGEGKGGELYLKDGGQNLSFFLDADGRSITITKPDGTDVFRFVLADTDTHCNIYAGGADTNANLILRNSEGKDSITLNAGMGKAVLGGNGNNSSLSLRNSAGKTTVQLSATPPTSSIIGALLDKGGKLSLRSSEGKDRITLDASNGNALLGGNGKNGNLFLRNEAGKIRIGLDAKAGDLRLRSKDGKERIRLNAEVSDARIGGNGEDGSLHLSNLNGKATVILSAEESTGYIYVGGNDGDGKLRVRNSDDKDTIELTAEDSTARIGGKGADGNLLLMNQDEQCGIRLKAEKQGGSLYLTGKDGEGTIGLDGESGIIHSAGSDCAEDFNVSESEQIEPGTVLVVDEENTLQQSKKAYDRRVVGVVSGAGDCRPGIVLANKRSQNKTMPVALMGRVYCKVEAQYSPIEVGDLLTTSSTPGHAMKADNPVKAFGAVIGKALSPLREGEGLIPILAALQ